MSEAASLRGRRWFEGLAGGVSALAGDVASVLAADAPLGPDTARIIAVVPDPNNRLPRARQGEIGIDEGWAIAARVREAIDGSGRPILAIVDVPSQAYGRMEELLGIHLSCAGAVDAYATARLAGHPVVSLVVGNALSGAFLAHGYQANRVLALNDPGVSIHAMGKAAAARVTRRSVADLERLGRDILPLAYDVASFAHLGLLHALIDGVNADSPTAADVSRVREQLVAAIADARHGPRDLSSRRLSDEARRNRAASILVREKLAAEWN
ncbi:biotin-independent malonate decarboxylase subunit gamma [Ancylobacter oerskovii]|uniref:Biotin-independent malonate decarboxylase subunit gamma n=1 Tax=Ancylobacter oerskovii TaxID=459519 RepID=A0ABW4YZI2_9HYPH|nr:biotin-independent malonate decarboxylase subunit gamma [Ancylobacter oerskovii]MBS7543985.1 biotin-independent malonate decarboxylase subunit gamma [Ancylobacter oerskovii]